MAVTSNARGKTEPEQPLLCEVPGGRVHHRRVWICTKGYATAKACLLVRCRLCTLCQVKLLMALRAVSAHPRLYSPPASPFVMAPAEEMSSKVRILSVWRANGKCMLLRFVLFAFAQISCGPADHSGRPLLRAIAGQCDSVANFG